MKQTFATFLELETIMLIRGTLFTICLFVIGCDVSKAPPAPTVMVSVDGTPAAGFFLQLVGTDGQAVASGTANQNGQAVMRSADGQAPKPGQYRVVVVDVDDGETNPMEKQKAFKSRVPTVYTKAATTKAQLTIEAGKMDYALDLKSKS